MVGTLSKGKYTYYCCNNKSRKKACDNEDINKEMIE
ncbi:recombinase zinc beta ribbon domain-containing protein [Caldisericum sp. AR60]